MQVERPASLLVLGYTKDMVWYVYVLQHSVTRQIYIGSTNNLKRRLQEHNHGKTKATHRVNGKWGLKYAELYPLKAVALGRENKLKHHGSAKQKLLERILNLLETKSEAGSGKRGSNT